MKRTMLHFALAAMCFLCAGCAPRPQRIELRQFYNAALDKQWHPGAEGNDLAELPTGEQTFAGVKFHVQGLIQLSGRFLIEWSDKYPKEVLGLPLKVQCKRLYFLHGTGWREKDGTRIGRYVVHYAGGEQREIPIVYGEDVRDWWVWSNDTQKTSRSVIAWIGANGASRKMGKSLRIYKSTWDNPTPSIEIQSIDFISEMSDSAPFLIAISAEP